MSGTKSVRVNLTLPEAFAKELRGLYSWRGTPSAELCAVLAAARRRGWTLQAIGTALGISRERIRQLAEIANPDQPITLEIPDLPPKPEPFKRVIPTLTEEQAEQLRELRGRSMAMGARSADHPGVVSGYQFAALVNGYVEAGHRLADIASRLGVTYGALNFRLGRYGFRRLAPSQQNGPGATSQFRQREQVTHAR